MLDVFGPRRAIPVSQLTGLVRIGTEAQKELDREPVRHILTPLEEAGWGVNAMTSDGSGGGPSGRAAIRLGPDQCRQLIRVPAAFDYEVSAVPLAHGAEPERLAGSGGHDDVLHRHTHVRPTLEPSTKHQFRRRFLSW